MIRSKDVNKEIRSLEEAVDKSSETSVLLKAVVKAITLLLKVVRDVRSNQVLGLKANGVKLIQPRIEGKERSNVKLENPVIAD